MWFQWLTRLIKALWAVSGPVMKFKQDLHFVRLVVDVLKVEFWKWPAVGERCRDGSVVGIRTPDGNILVHAVPY